MLTLTLDSSIRVPEMSLGMENVDLWAYHNETSHDRMPEVTTLGPLQSFALKYVTKSAAAGGAGSLEGAIVGIHD